MQTLAFHTMDVFTAEPFTGNSLAIVLDADPLSNRQMQKLAREFNLPETLFIQTASDAVNTAKVRIFTPVDEIPFAGHPTIGCAIYLAEQLHKNNDKDFNIEIRLEENAGLVPVQVERSNGKINARFTAPVIPTPSRVLELPSSPTLTAATAAQALGLNQSDIDTNNSQPRSHAGGPTFLFVSLNNLAAIAKAQALEPVCTQLSHSYGATGIYVYHIDSNSNEIDARMFAPAAGIPEDPATGSATAILASQLLEDKQLVDGHNCFTVRQGYDMGRPSDLLLDIECTDGAIQVVKVSGSSVSISAGTVRVPM